MNSIKGLNWLIGGLVVLLVLGFLASRVGGIAIRHQTGEPLRTLSVTSQPVLPGTQQEVTWDTQSADNDQPIVFFFRSRSGEQLVGSSFLNLGQARLPFPCSGVHNGTLVMRDQQDQHVIAQAQVALLPAGRECVTQSF